MFQRYRILKQLDHNSKLAASGYNSNLTASGENSVVAGIGEDCKCKAVKGCWIVLMEYDNNCNPIGGIVKIVDGIEVKENTWYMVKNGKLIEYKE